MAIKEEYGLSFERLKVVDWGLTYTCSGSSSIEGSGSLALLLDMLSDNEPQFLLDEVELAITGGSYEEYYSPDGAQGHNGVRIVSPNAIINGTFTMPLTELKLLLQEWIAFVEQ